MVELELFAHPFSGYSQKALIALWENAIPFSYRVLDHADLPTMARFRTLWPIERFPILVQGDRTIVEATSIIEYLAVHHPQPVALIPTQPDAAVEVRMLDRFFDNYIATPQGRIVFDAVRKPEDRDPFGVAEQQTLLDRAYRWLDQHMAARTWAAGDTFTMADCAAAPALFYAQWTHPIDPPLMHVHAYRRRLLTRPSFARAVNEARPFRNWFPLGAPVSD